jgi:hypothetical protein
MKEFSTFLLALATGLVLTTTVEAADEPGMNGPGAGLASTAPEQGHQTGHPPPPPQGAMPPPPPPGEHGGGPPPDCPRPPGGSPPGQPPQSK